MYGKVSNTYKSRKLFIFCAVILTVFCAVLLGTAKVAYASTGGGYEYSSNGNGTIVLKEYIDTGKTSIQIPSTINGKTVTEIGNDCFYKNNTIETVVCPKTVTKIGDGAFYYCESLKSVEIQGNVEIIDAGTFYGCKNLKTVKLPEGLELISRSAFYNCRSLESISLPDSVVTIDQYAFGSCDLSKGVKLSGSLANIEAYAFTGCNFEKIEIPGSVKSIGSGAFKACDKLKEVKVNNSTCSIADDMYVFGLRYAWTPANKTVLIGSSNSTLYKYYQKYSQYYNFSTGKVQHTHSYKDTVKAKATLSKNGKIVRKCTTCGASSNITVYKPTGFTLSNAVYIYDGKNKKPGITITANGSVISSSNYKLTYDKNTKNIGKHKVKITFKGNYKGTKTVYYNIKPAEASSVKVTSKKSGKADISFKKVKGVSNYEVKYAANSKFTKAKTVKIGSSAKKTISKLSKGKNYYFKVRAYKTVSGKKVYGDWSSTVICKIKK